MSVEIKGPAVFVFLILGGIFAYFVLSLRLPANLAVALALFGTCVTGLFVFAFRTAMKDRERSHHHH